MEPDEAEDPLAQLDARAARFAELTGAHQGWLRICQNWRAGAGVLQAEFAGNRAALGDRELAWPAGADAWTIDRNRSLAAAQATYNLALALAGADPDVLIAESAAYWAAAHQKTGTAHPRPDAAVHGEAGGLIERVTSQSPGAVVPFMSLLICELAGVAPQAQARARIAVLYDRDAAGEAGTLTLTRCRDGPPGLYPDPAKMILLATDRAFANATSTAWGRSSQARDEACVLWSLEIDGEPLHDVRGGSLGGAFAVGLAELERVHHRTAKYRTRALDDRCAITATLASDGKLGSVGGMPAKLLAAKDAGLRVITAAGTAAQAAELHAKAAKASVHLSLAGTVEEAVQESRRARSRRLVALSVLLVLALSAGTYFFAAARHDQSVNRQNALVRRADELRNEAAAVGTENGFSRQTEAQLLLSAQALALRAHNPGLADTIVRTQLTSQSGVLGQVGASLHGQLNNLTALDGGSQLLADSDSGELMLIDPGTSDVLGTYTEPPGTDSLGQAIERAVAPLPGSDLFAVIFQVPVGPFAGPASLAMFSATSKLTRLGSVSDFTRRQVDAATFWHRGTRLITASADAVTYWNTSNETPTQLLTCRWRTRAQTGLGAPVSALDDIGKSRPLLVLSSGAVIALPSWTPTPGGPCLGRTILAPRQTLHETELSDTSVAANFNEDHRLDVFTVTRDHALLSTVAGSRSQVLLAHGVAGVGSFDGSELPVALKSGRLELLSVESAREPRRIATFAHVGLPAVYAGGTFFGQGTGAATEGAIESLDPAHETFIAGGTLAGQGNSDEVAANTGAIAVAYGDAVGAYRLSIGAPAQLVPIPRGYAFAPGDGRIGATLSVSAGARYCAAVLVGRRPEPGFSAQQTLYVFDMQTHHVTALTPPPGVVRPGIRPLSVQFVPGGDQLIVSYYTGALISYVPRGDVWVPSYWASTASSGSSVAAAVGRQFVFRVETAGTRQLVRAYDLHGVEVDSWPLNSVPGPISIGGGGQLAQIVPLSNQGKSALLILDSGTAYKLEPDGRIGPAISLGSADITTAAQVPSRDEIVIGTSTGTTILDTRTDVLLPQQDPFGPLTSLAATPDGSYLVGTDPLQNATVLQALERRTISADLCELAGGGVSRSVWAEYVGRLAPYGPICAGFFDALHEAAAVSRVSSQTSTPYFLEAVPSAQTRALARSCAGLPDGANRIGALSWTPLRSAGAVGGRGAICVGGAPVWRIADRAAVSIEPGGSAAHPFLLLSRYGYIAGDGRAQYIDVVDDSGAVPLATETNSRQSPVLAGSQATAFSTVGALRVATTYAQDLHTSAWVPVQQEPSPRPASAR